MPGSPSARSPTCSTDPSGSVSRPATRCNERSASSGSSATNPDGTCGRGGAGRSAISVSPSPIRSSRTSPAAIEEVARRHGLAMFLCNSDGDPSREADYLEMLLEQRVRGALVSPFGELTPQFERLRRRGIAVVLVGIDVGRGLVQRRSRRRRRRRAGRQSSARAGPPTHRLRRRCARRQVCGRPAGRQPARHWQPPAEMPTRSR